MVLPKKVIKRDGSLQDFDKSRIENAIKKAMLATNSYSNEKLNEIVSYVTSVIEETFGAEKYPHVEEIQDIVEFSLMKFGLFNVAKAYVLYRKEREKIRKEKMKILEKDYIDEVDKKFSLNALRVLAARYLLKNEEGKIIESPKQLFQRVAMLVVIPDILYDERIFDKEGNQIIRPKEPFDPVEYEGKLGFFGKEKEKLEISWNRYHLERMKYLYDELNSKGHMKVSWSEFLEILKNGEFQEYRKNFEEYYSLMVEKKFIPNSPTLFNAGTRLGQLSACFVLDIDDDMESIMDAAKEAAIIFKSGGGVGINYSKLRPEGDIVASTSGVASGPISFMRIIDTVTEVVKQGGKRRGANMGILEIWHPDIEKFITAKASENFLENFNISVLITPEFWDYLEKDKKYPLINPRTRKPVKYVKPKDLFELIAQMAWKTGDPGVLFEDNINKHNVLKKHLGPIKATNPCVTGDTLVLTDRGLLEAKDLKEGMQVWTLEGWRPIEKVFNNGVRDVYEIELKNGLRLKVTKEHKLLTDKGWKKVEELREGEKIRVVLEGPERYGNADSMHEGFAEFLGFWVGDGSLSISDHVRLHVGKELELAEYFEGGLSSFASHSSVVENSGQFIVDVHRKKFADKIRDIFGIKVSRSTEKRVPQSILRSEKNVQAAFLRGLFTADGSVYDANGTVTISLSSTSRKLLEKVQIMLLSFGIFSVLTKEKEAGLKKIKGKEYFSSNTFRLLINGEDAFKFFEKIGLLGKKGRKLENLIKNKRFYQKDRKFVEIKSIKYIGKEEVFDIRAPPTFTWVTNGIYSYDCGEEPLYPYESCNLGSINVFSFIKEDEKGKKYFDWEEFREVIKVGYRFLDNIIDVNKYPLKKIEEMTKKTRRVGLGLMGIADVLFALGIPYNSEEGFNFMSKLAETLTFFAMKESVERAKKRGVFPLFQNSSYLDGEMPIEGFYHREEWNYEWDKLLEDIKKFGIRNVEVTVVAPTGSISMIADTSSGIEPQFALVYHKHVTIGSFYYVDPVFEEELKRRGIYSEEILRKISENGGSVLGIEEIPEDMKKVFVTSYDIPWWDHLRAQAAFQRWICSSISKTINMPHWVSIEDVKNAYLFAHKLGLKGVTVYREGSKSKQVLVTPTQREEKYISLVENKTLEIMKKFGIDLKNEEVIKRNNHLSTNLKVGLPFSVKKEAEIGERPMIRKCPVCGSSDLIYKEGCITCANCGWSECVIS